MDIKHKRLKHSQHYNGNKGCLSCGINIQVENIEEETILHFTGLNTTGIMTKCGIVADINSIDDIINALANIRKKTNEKI